MKPFRHAVVSFSIGLTLWFFTKSVYAGLLCFASGVLIDGDHIVEYIIHHNWKTLTVKMVYQASEETGRQEGDYRFTRLYLLSHTIELVILLWILTIATRNLYILAITIGYSSHMILDCAANPMHWYSYFMFWRIRNRFDADKLYDKKKLEKFKKSQNY